MNITNFHLPRSREIPDIGLFLEQTVRYLNGALAPLGEEEITASMVSNYVKTGLLPKPEKKLYYPAHIRALFYIATMKSTVSLEDIALFTELDESAYDRFCDSFEHRLFAAPPNEENNTPEKEQIAEQMILAAVSKILLDRTVKDYRNTLPQKEEKKEKKKKPKEE